MSKQREKGKLFLSFITLISNSHFIVRCNSVDLLAIKLSQLSSTTSPPARTQDRRIMLDKQFKKKKKEPPVRMWNLENKIKKKSGGRWRTHALADTGPLWCWSLDNRSNGMSTERRRSSSRLCWLVLIVARCETSLSAVTTWGWTECDKEWREDGDDQN